MDEDIVLRVNNDRNMVPERDGIQSVSQRDYP